MKNIHEYMTWAASHAVLRETDGTLFVDPAIIGTDPWKYLFGTTGKRCTRSVLEERYKNYYSKHDWTRKEFDAATAGWVENEEIACDCQGLEDFFSGADTNARGNYANYCSDAYKGAIEDIVRPCVFGEAIFCGKTEKSIFHVMWVIGLMPDGEPIVLHERGLAHGCVIERLSKCGKRYIKWRGLMDKRYEHTVVAANTAVEEEAVDPPAVRNLCLRSPMMRGDDVKALQTRLAALGYPVGKIDGIYGSKTDVAVRTYQLLSTSVRAGVVDEATRRLLGL